MKIYDAEGQTKITGTSVLLTSAYMSAIGKLGGKARLIKMTAAARKRIAKKAIRTRWRKVSRERRLQQQEGKRE